jgi:cellulose synthase/poly-beta-1,6-N-acetylglucosamine synthase-like glycosyltransferase
MVLNYYLSSQCSLVNKFLKFLNFLKLLTFLTFLKFKNEKKTKFPKIPDSKLEMELVLIYLIVCKIPEITKIPFKR